MKVELENHVVPDSGPQTGPKVAVNLKGFENQEL